MMNYTKQQILDVVNHQLLFWIKKDKSVRDAVIELTQTRHPSKKEMDEKFDRVLKELANDREIQKTKWEAQEKKWEAQEKKWEAQEKKWEAQEKKWEAQEKKWEAQEKKWEEAQKITHQLLNDIKELNKKYTVNLGAIGSRWGRAAETSFRGGLKSILETDFPVKVRNYNKMDHECLVYKRPRPVELDVIIHNNKVILCEISASFSSDEVDAFVKKIEFYEKMENVKVSRSMIISPMITPDALEEAKYYNIEVFTYPERKMF